MRGEYHYADRRGSFGKELPPRARRIPTMPWMVSSTRGTTSACAENTRSSPYAAGRGWNYLRVRGEYRRRGLPVNYTVELPPRARRILTILRRVPLDQGTTSACAENTGRFSLRTLHYWNYLRVRGEYSPPPFPTVKTRELPPRARRILSP